MLLELSKGASNNFQQERTHLFYAVLQTVSLIKPPRQGTVPQWGLNSKFRIISNSSSL